MGVFRVPFGALPDGRPADLFAMTNPRGLRIEFTNLGGIVTRILAPDRAGTLANVNAGFATLAAYFRKVNYYGALVGRVGNRIAAGRFSLDGREYRLAKNNNGVNHLHGGEGGAFSRALWTAEVPDPAVNRVLLRLQSPDGENGYPGNLDVRVVYALSDDGEWTIDYTATTDAPTPVNLTHHAFFNLNGFSDTVLGHTLQLAARRYTPTGEGLIPTGEIAPVAPELDFTTEKPVGRDIGRVAGGGYDHNFVLDRADFADRVFLRAAVLHDPASGRTLEAWTTEPGLQVYSANFCDGTEAGAAGERFVKHGAICLEAQHFPNAVNTPAFPGVVLRPGQVYRQTTAYKFGVRR